MNAERLTPSEMHADFSASYEEACRAMRHRHRHPVRRHISLRRAFLGLVLGAIIGSLCGCVAQAPDPTVQHVTFQQRTDLFHAHADALGSGALQ